MPKPKAFEVPQRELFDIVATNDISHLAIALGHQEVTSPTRTRGSDEEYEVPAAAENDDETLLHPPKTHNNSSNNGGSPDSPTKQPKKTQQELTDEVISYRDSYGYSALHIAANYGHETICQLLIDAGIDVNAKTDLGRTALHSAAENGYDSVVNLLLDNGADPAVFTRGDFVTPLQLAKQNKYGSIVVTLEPLTVKKTDLSKDPIAAAVDGDVLYFILSHAEGKARAIETATNETNDNCITALCSTTGLVEEEKGAPKYFEGGVLSFLIEKKLYNVNYSNSTKMTALMCAAKSGYLQAVKILLQHGADPTLTYDEEGNKTAFDLTKSQEMKLVLNVAIKKQDYMDIYAQRNEVAYKDRPAYAQQVRGARQEIEEAEEALAEFYAPKKKDAEGDDEAGQNTN